MKATPEREADLAEFKAIYASAHFDTGRTRQSEAFALGVTDSTALAYMDSENVERNLPAALVPHSRSRATLMHYLADKCGGVFVEVNASELNGSYQDELSAILHDISRLVKEHDPSVCRRIFSHIEKMAARGAKEVQ